MTPPDASNRVLFSAEQLQTTLDKAGYQVMMQQGDTTFSDPEIKTILLTEVNDTTLKKEGFHITTTGNLTRVSGRDGSGVIYGCRELIDLSLIHISTKEGYKEFAVSPVLGGLKWMEGTVPTPNGDIHVYMDNKTIKVKATEGKGYLTIQSRRQPKANMGTVEKVSEGVWRLWIDSPEERIVTYRM